MLSIAAALVIGQLPPPDRLRTVLPNGAAILVERMPNQPSLTVQLFASAKFTPETPATHGFRHLLEHLVARGQSGSIDQRLESKGAFLRASTLRDAMQFEISLSPKDLSLGMETLSELLAPLKVTPRDIGREAAVIEQEIGLSNDAASLAAAAWTAAFGEQGLDPQGDMATIRTATPDALAQVQSRQFAPSALTLVIAGDVDVNEATRQGKALLSLPSGGYKAVTARGEGKSGRVECQGFGEARAATCGAFGGISNAAELAFAFAVASEVDGCFLTYTPSQERGLITVGRTDQSSGVGLYIDGLTVDDLPPMLERGKALVKTWIESQLRNPTSSSNLRGLLMCQRHSASPEELLESLDLVDTFAFEKAFGAFAKERAVIVVGVR